MLVGAILRYCVNNYKKTRLINLKVSASVWFNKQCQAYHVTPKYSQMHIRYNNIRNTKGNTWP